MPNATLARRLRRAVGALRHMSVLAARYWSAEADYLAAYDKATRQADEIRARVAANLVEFPGLLSGGAR